MKKLSLKQNLRSPGVISGVPAPSLESIQKHFNQVEENKEKNIRP